MRREDISQVSVIDREAFPTMLPPLNFERELRNKLTHYYVVCDGDKSVEIPAVTPDWKSGTGLIDKLKRLFSSEVSSESGSMHFTRYIGGYVGFWVMADEAHITTIAVREELQRQGIGELMIIAVLNLAREMYAQFVTLEVRASNTGAQNLYRKYGFKQTGVRKGYYTDNREDGLVMTTGDITSAAFREQIEQLTKVYRDKRDIIIREGDA